MRISEWSSDVCSTDLRDSDRYRARRDGRDDRSYRYGTRGQFGGPGSGYGGSGNRRPADDYEPDERGFLDRAGDEIRIWFGDEEAERRRPYDDSYNRPYCEPRGQNSPTGAPCAVHTGPHLHQHVPNLPQIQSGKRML